jgi:alcohol dehydrogenase class IV
MDALVQAIESLFSVHSVPVTEALSLAAAELIVDSIVDAYEDGRNLDARSAMSQGSYMAGLALGSARLGAVHGLAHPVGVCYHLPHGVVCAALMPPVLRANMESEAEKSERLEIAMGGDPILVLEELMEDLSLQATLGPYPDPEWERRIVEYAVSSGSGKANPVPVDEGYARGILEQVCEP